MGLVCVALVVLSAGAASAQETQMDTADQEARARFEAGSLAYSQGRYEAAMNDFRQAYELSHRPGLLFNIGAAAQSLRRDPEALEAFEAYLREVPDAPNRAAVEARIEILRRAIADGGSARSAPDSAGSTSPSAAGIGLLAGGAAVAIAGAIVLALGQVDYAAVANAPRGTEWSTVEEAYGRAEPMSIAGGVGLGVGIAAAAIGVVLLIAVPDRQERAALEWSFDL